MLIDDHVGCTRLWQAVILQAFSDAEMTSQYSRMQKHKHTAISFLKGWSGDFDYVAELAAIDPCSISYRRFKAAGGSGREFLRVVRSRRC